MVSPVLDIGKTEMTKTVLVLKKFTVSFHIYGAKLNPICIVSSLCVLMWIPIFTQTIRFCASWKESHSISWVNMCTILMHPGSSHNLQFYSSSDLMYQFQYIVNWLWLCYYLLFFSLLLPFHSYCHSLWLLFHYYYHCIIATICIWTLYLLVH